MNITFRRVLPSVVVGAVVGVFVGLSIMEAAIDASVTVYIVGKLMELLVGMVIGAIAWTVVAPLADKGGGGWLERTTGKRGGQVVAWALVGGIVGLVFGAIGRSALELAIKTGQGALIGMLLGPVVQGLVASRG